MLALPQCVGIATLIAQAGSSPSPACLRMSAKRVHASWAAEAHRTCVISDILVSEAFLPIRTKSIGAVLKQCNDLLMVGKKTVNIGTVLKRLESMLS